VPRLSAATATAVAAVLALAACSTATPDEVPGTATSGSPSTSATSITPTPPPTATPASPTATRPGADAYLLRAASAGDAAGVRAALAGGADVEAEDDLGRTALVRAAYGNHLEAARVLVRAGADPNHLDASTQSPFLIATSEVGDDPRLVDLLLAHGADLRVKDSYNGTGLIRAADRGFPVIIGRLLDAGIEIDHVNRLGWTALHEAVVLGDGSRRYQQVVRRLLDAGADPLLRTQKDGVLPQTHARQRGFTRIATMLQEASVGLTPAERLLRHARGGSVAAAEAALADGADLEARDARGRTALLLAATEDRVEMAQMLVARGADVNALDGRHDTPFLVTGVTGSVAMLKALLPGEPDTRIRNRYGGVAVIPASERGHAEYVAAVLELTDIDVNHVNDLGWTALLEAVILGDGGPRHQAVVRALLEGGADRTIADRDGVTPLEHARARGQTAVVALLS
jgi:ankyrin repeat protein